MRRAVAPAPGSSVGAASPGPGPRWPRVPDTRPGRAHDTAEPLDERGDLGLNARLVGVERLDHTGDGVADLAGAALAPPDLVEQIRDGAPRERLVQQREELGVPLQQGADR